VLLGIIALTGWNLTRSTHLDAAEAAFRRSETRTALQHALDHLERRPWSRPASLIAARCLSNLGFAAEAEPYYQRQPRLSVEDQQLRALGLIRLNRQNEAEAIYNAILDERPGDPTALRRLSVLHLTRGDILKAIESAKLLTFSRDLKTQIIGWTMVATFYHNARYVDEALPAYAKVLELDPELQSMPLPRRDFWGPYLEDLVRNGQGRRAMPLIERALGEVGEDPELRFLLARAYQLDGNVVEAARAARRATELNPDAPGPWAFLGRLELSQGRAQAALEPLERALAVDGQSYSTLYSLIQANTQLGRRDEVARLTARAEALRLRLGGTPTTGMNPDAMPKP
jgi:tetratricopeptide (TPR) repeat protein